MKLLFDENLSFKIKVALQDDFPGSKHTAELGLSQVRDLEIWEYAKVNGFAIVTKDADFSVMLLLKGFPPKVIWLKRGNTNTKELIAIFKEQVEVIQTFLKDPEKGSLEIF